MPLIKSTKSREKRIRQGLVNWSAQNPRVLPWKASKDPYRIWVSEMILQQTRVEQGLPYYERFITRYPQLKDLAITTEDDLMKMWEGLGYYRRARYMLSTAKEIVERYPNSFPNTYEEILALKGVGPYTAAAIASFAFDLPYVVVDGNVNRLISRLYGIREAIEEADVKKRIEKIAQGLLDRQNPDRFNQAIMDFGSLLCKPANPDCANCPLTCECIAHQQDLVKMIPAKKVKKPKRKRFFYYLVPKVNDRVFVKKRTNGDIWPNLFEFYLIEGKKLLSWEEILLMVDLPILQSSSQPKKYKQVLSHQIIYAEFLVVELQNEEPFMSKLNYTAISTKKIRNFAFPKVINCFLRDKDVILNYI